MSATSDNTCHKTWPGSNPSLRGWLTKPVVMELLRFCHLDWEGVPRVTADNKQYISFINSWGTQFESRGKAGSEGFGFSQTPQINVKLVPSTRRWSLPPLPLQLSYHWMLHSATLAASVSDAQLKWSEVKWRKCSDAANFGAGTGAIQQHGCRRRPA
jgi:hypothetical protein